MKADPIAQQRLLDLQTIDTTLAQLAHRRDRLPEHAALEQLARQLSDIGQERSQAQVEVDGLDRDIARLERDVDQVRDRKERDATRLAQGTGPARELSALQSELVSLDRRQRELEDEQLALMERREQAQATLDEVNARHETTEQRRAEAVARRDAALAEIAQEEAGQRELREPLVAELPADLVALYERIRTDAAGVGAAALVAGRCGGCRLELSGSERARIRAAAPDEVQRCEECRRILVRTDGSGL